ncbi:hypothetical protein I3760_02G105500 [Carya illinoinensis]|nr:hypothetical protein I3760_02G105500 [Carya illinoinensis]
MDLSDINELHAAAFAYYRNASQDVRERACAFFNAMDMDRDGQVCLFEFVTFFRECGYNWIDGNTFRAFDRNGDGSLDFYEVLTLYYTMKTRSVWCRVCRVWLTRLYFTCLACYDSCGDTYDLCPTCCARDEIRFQHGWNGHPNIFIDSYVLLRARRRQMPAAAAPNMSLALVLRPAPQRPRFDWWNVLHLLEVAVSAASLCSIM